MNDNFDNAQADKAILQKLQENRVPGYRTVKEAVAEIRAALKARSSIPWSVTHGTGTAYGWITITVAPRRRTPEGRMTEFDAAALGKLLDLKIAFTDGVSVAAGGDYRQEYIARARGETPTVFGTPYWD